MPACSASVAIGVADDTHVLALIIKQLLCCCYCSSWLPEPSLQATVIASRPLAAYDTGSETSLQQPVSSTSADCRHEATAVSAALSEQQSE